MTINYTVNILSGDGIDSRLMFPGTLANRMVTFSATSTQGRGDFVRIVNGQLQEDTYSLVFAGSNFTYNNGVSGTNDLQGNITSATLSLAGNLIAQLVIDDTAGSFTANGGVPMTSIRGFSPDTITSIASFYGTSFTINGNSGADKLFGSGFGDTLDGKAGADVMQGGAGDDTYYVDNARDLVIEIDGDGIDTVNSSVSFALGSQYIENLTLTGTANVDASGNSLANMLTGNSGANVLNGSTGADTMAGGAGADTYYVDNAGDRIIEGNVAGIDLVYSTVSIGLGSQYVENVTLTGTAAISATGNSLANKLVGNSGANVLNGSTGLDTMTGGAGADKFWFSTAASAANVDHITDFRVVDDTIQISRSVFSAITGTGTLTAAQFVANSTGTATNTNQHIIYNTSNGQLFYDTNGSTAGGSTLFAVIDNHATAGTLTNADFLIV